MGTSCGEFLKASSLLFRSASLTKRIWFVAFLFPFLLLLLSLLLLFLVSPVFVQALIKHEFSLLYVFHFQTARCTAEKFQRRTTGFKTLNAEQVSSSSLMFLRF